MSVDSVPSSPSPASEDPDVDAQDSEEGVERSTGRSRADGSFSNLGGPMIQVEAIGTWSEFCFFVSLFMRHQHALVPLIHKPTFAMDVLNRKDQRDESFRGLLFSIGEPRAQSHHRGTTAESSHIHVSGLRFVSGTLD